MGNSCSSTQWILQLAAILLYLFSVFKKLCVFAFKNIFFFFCLHLSNQNKVRF